MTLKAFFFLIYIFLNNLISHTIQQRHGHESHDLELYHGSQVTKLLLERFCTKFHY